MANLQQAFSVAEKEFDVIQLLDAEGEIASLIFISL